MRTVAGETEKGNVVRQNVKVAPVDLLMIMGEAFKPSGVLPGLGVLGKE